MKMFKPGVSFSDFVVQDFATKKSKVPGSETRDFRRGWVVWLGVVLSLALIVVRLVVMQLIEGGKYRVLADENRVKQIKVMAARAEIVDRNGLVLATSTPEEKEVNGLKIPSWKRVYPYGPATAHVVGYLSEVGEDEVGLLKAEKQKYDLGDLIGRMGLEKSAEKELRGVDGGRLVEVDNAGGVVRELGAKLPQPSQPLKTSLDAELSITALVGLKQKKGAVVASNPQTGEILVLVSSPSFEPNKIMDEYEQLSTSPDLPFLNRAISGGYPPGSTFKMTTAAAALESGKVKANFTFADTGVMTVAGFRYTNWLFTKNGGTEGQVGFTRAITRSVDTFFYKIGELIGPETMGEWASKFGFGQVSGVEINGEIAGVVASPEYKQKMTGERWFLGNSYHMAIGQGDTLTTPLQVNLMTNLLAMSGRKCAPTLRRLAQLPPCGIVDISDQTLDIIHDGMVAACSNGGTAFPLFDWNEAALNHLPKSTYAKSQTGEPLPLIACKTGTAEYVAENGKIKTHAWLTAYAPADKPEISVTALLEGGGEGSNAAAPIVRQVLARYFQVTDTYPYDRIPQEVGE